MPDAELWVAAVVTTAFSLTNLIAAVHDSHIDWTINCLRHCACLLDLLTYSELRGYTMLDTLFLRWICDNAEDSGRAYFELLYQYFLQRTAGSTQVLRHRNSSTHQSRGLTEYRGGMINKPITVAAWSNAWNVFALLNAGIMGSNPIRGMEVCLRLLCVCVVLCRWRSLATGSSPVQGILPTV
jgi:hypothetical protein